MNITEYERRENRIRCLNKVSIGMSAILLLFIVLDQSMNLSSKNDILIQTIYFLFILVFVALRLTLFYNKRKSKITPSISMK